MRLRDGAKCLESESREGRKLEGTNFPMAYVLNIGCSPNFCLRLPFSWHFPLIYCSYTANLSIIYCPEEVPFCGSRLNIIKSSNIGFRRHLKIISHILFHLEYYCFKNTILILYHLLTYKLSKMIICLHAQLLSRVRLFVILWTVAWQAPLPMGFSK